MSPQTICSGMGQSQTQGPCQYDGLNRAAWSQWWLRRLLLLFNVEVVWQHGAVHHTPQWPLQRAILLDLLMKSLQGEGWARGRQSVTDEAERGGGDASQVLPGCCRNDVVRADVHHVFIVVQAHLQRQKPVSILGKISHGCSMHAACQLVCLLPKFAMQRNMMTARKSCKAAH